MYIKYITWRIKTEQNGSDLEKVSILARLLQLTKKVIFCRSVAALTAMLRVTW